MFADHIPSSRRIFTTGDARRLARRRLPRLVFDFLEGGVGHELALAGNRAALDRIRLQPRVLGDVSRRSLATRFLGNEFGLPFGIAPMGMCNLTHPGADDALARLAVAAGIPVCLSTAASTSLERMAEMTSGQAWFQLYVGQSAEQGLALAERARLAGYRTLVLTVDAPQVSRRARDLRNGFQVPFRMGPRQVLDFALHPFWSLPMLAAGAPRFGNFDPAQGFKRGESRAGADWGFLDRLRDAWPGHLIVKGVLSPVDARRIRSAGADAIWVSNHGGRQLDSAPAPVDVLPAIRDAVGADLPLIADSGLEGGEDIVKVLALGADFAMLGRPWMYALGAEGERGLVTLARLLAEEVDTTMAQIGVCSVDQITAATLAAQHQDEAPGPAPMSSTDAT